MKKIKTVKINKEAGRTAGGRAGDPRPSAAVTPLSSDSFNPNGVSGNFLAFIDGKDHRKKNLLYKYLLLFLF